MTISTPAQALDGTALRAGVVVRAARTLVHRWHAVQPGCVTAVQVPFMRACLQQLQVPANSFLVLEK